jgi:Cft2 family RNA processing exonuclease
MATITFTNLTRANEIGANCYVLDFGGDGKVVLDCGMHPQCDGIEALPDLSALKLDSVDAIFVSHAHHDHIGSLPVLLREQSQAHVYLSEPTYHLADPLLHNSVEIMKKQRAEKGIIPYPLYTHRELQEQAHVWQAVGLSRAWSLNGYPDPESEPLSFTFHDAGHILGSVGIEFNHRGRRVLYTGDVNFLDQTLMRGAAFPEDGIDALIIECTRGAQAAREGFSRGNELQRLAQAIQETFEAGGSVLIPVFAMGKTQEMLAELHFLQRRGCLPGNPIFIGGLGRAFTSIYDKLAVRSRRRHERLQLLEDVRPHVMDGKLARSTKARRGHVYLISSGMMTESTLSNFFGEQFLAVERHAIFFVGYCDPESPAGRLKATPRGAKVMLNPSAGEQPVLCRVEAFDLTSHALREDLLAYILRLRPEVCVLVHGDPPALEWFRGQLNAQAPRMRVVIPHPGEPVSL